MDGTHSACFRPEARPRIVTLTMNPAVDLACTAASVRPTHKIRTFDERFDPGGGGINVARVAHALGGDSRALILTGGVTGRLVEELLDEGGVLWQAIPIRGRTRISLNVQEQATGLEYRFVPEGPTIEESEWQAALATLASVEAEWIVASGSLPPGVPVDFYAQAAAVAGRRGQSFALDTSGPALHTAVGQGVALLKLSLGELEYLIGRNARTAQDQEAEVTALLRGKAARMIAVSLGAEGAIFGHGDAIIRLSSPAIEARSAVGAGDSFLAGLVLGLGQGMSDRDALALGIAAGTTAVLSYGTALVSRDDVAALFEQISRAEPVAL